MNRFCLYINCKFKFKCLVNPSVVKMSKKKNFTEILCLYPNDLDENLLATNVKSSYSIGESVRYSCKNGYKIPEKEMGLVIVATCSGMGEWSIEPPSCEGMTILFFLSYGCFHGRLAQLLSARYRCRRSGVPFWGRSDRNSVANGSLPLRRFFGAVLLKREDGLRSSLYASA